ncbi:hypothetical protein WJX81_006822 [Elliptochloris bilobata]|uniref:Uncharacterized protein n=1 Tax=Elliptochloris bilobata TaxID=381761 RepID=A0AAW1S0F2_9CHLO
MHAAGNQAEPSTAATLNPNPMVTPQGLHTTLQVGKPRSASPGQQRVIFADLPAKRLGAAVPDVSTGAAEAAPRSASPGQQRVLFADLPGERLSMARAVELSQRAETVWARLRKHMGEVVRAAVDTKSGRPIPPHVRTQENAVCFD